MQLWTQVSACVSPSCMQLSALFWYATATAPCVVAIAYGGSCVCLVAIKLCTSPWYGCASLACNCSDSKGGSDSDDEKDEQNDGDDKEI